jgi:hypothetical protein
MGVKLFPFSLFDVGEERNDWLFMSHMGQLRISVHYDVLHILVLSIHIVILYLEDHIR